eukprot:c20449_g2_i1.p1 GENE.c20449_g2_i1~~c20449_g2_i1.p1  ORF type:complete len:913 (-),score=391.39 c20449_g2_i1:30-2747(-)
MHTLQTKPEVVLKRANDLRDGGDNIAALDIIQTTIKGKRNVWSQSMEDLMILCIEICVDLRKGKIVKDTLLQYRTVCLQMSGVVSLEKCVKHFLKLAHERVEEAYNKAQRVVLDIEDLEEQETPESMMLKAVSGEDEKDRTDREIVTPWLKFLWETFRTILDVSRNNNKLEVVYQQTAQKAFEFCVKYQRLTEFRRLCEILRYHLVSIHKTTNQLSAINLNNPETLKIHLQSRFAQLNAAAQLELWQESFRSIEDIHSLIALSKKKPPPSLMADYFDKLAKVFWVSENYLCHTCAAFRYFMIQRSQNKQLSKEDLAIMASSVILAVLSIPPEIESANLLELDIEKQKMIRMFQLLNLNFTPTRTLLMDSLKSANVFESALPEVTELYQALEVQFHPLEICSRVKPLLEKLRESPKLQQYAGPLQKLSIIRLLQQLGQVYRNIKISELLKLASLVDRIEMHRIIIQTLEHTGNISIDHQNDIIRFNQDSLFTGHLKSQLTELYGRLNASVELIHPENFAKLEEKKKAALEELNEHIEKEHEKILSRRDLIESRKEETEKNERAKLEAQKKEEELKRQQLAQMEQQSSLEAREELRRIEKEKEKQTKLEQEKQKLVKQLEQTITQTKGKKSAKAEITKLSELDENKLREEQERQKRKLKEEHDEKLQELEKSIDFLERAKRKLEISKRLKEYEQQKEDDRKFFEAEYEEAVVLSKREHEKLLERKALIDAAQSHKKSFLKHIEELREIKFQKDLESWTKEFQDWKPAAHQAKKVRVKKQMIEAKREEQKQKLKEKEKSSSTNAPEKKIDLEKARVTQMQVEEEVARKEKAREEARKQQELEEKKSSSEKDGSKTKEDPVNWRARPKTDPPAPAKTGVYVPPSRLKGSTPSSSSSSSAPAPSSSSSSL